MYRKFYGLARRPFEMSPDPFFYYPTQQHNEALALLTWGVQDKKGLVVVSGEVGTGKTLLVRCLLDSLQRQEIAFAYVYNPVLSVQEFLLHLLNEFGVTYKSNSKIDLLSSLNRHLSARSRCGQTTVLVVDEAQLLSWELLEEIRLLSNLETSEFKLLQTVLVGQTELEQKLDSRELRQLKQRISMRCRLKPLELADEQGYIRRRLELAGANSHGTVIYPDETIETVHKFSLGIPRLTNTICQNTLIVGYSRQAKHITPGIVQEVAMDLRLDLTTPDSATPKSESPKDVPSYSPRAGNFETFMR